MEEFLWRWNKDKQDTAEKPSEFVEKIYNWFMENGAFLGTAPSYPWHIIDNERTPFERLYFVYDALRPIVALRLRPRAFEEKRLSDAYELIAQRTGETDLALYSVNWEYTPEVDCRVDESEFVAAFPADTIVRLV